MTAYQTPLAYASPAAKGGGNAWAGTAIVAGGLALVVLGGCFLIGVLAIVSPQVFFASAKQTALTGPEIALMIVLYLLAFLSFAGGAALLVLGVRGLLRLLGDRPGL
jgi:hypothetical protein